MIDISIGLLSNLAEQLLQRSSPRLCELGPGQPNEAVRPLLDRLTPDTLLAAGKAGDHSMATGCCAALWLYHDFLDESHCLSQEIETPEGSYWHGIMHRREPDPDNAKYWFRRVGRHPVFEALRVTAAELCGNGAVERVADFLKQQTTWEPYRWIDLCEEARTGRTQPATVEVCRRIQLAEWQLLFDYCLRRA